MTYRPNQHCADCGLYTLFGDRRYRIQWWPLQIVITHKECGGATKSGALS